MQGGIRVGGGGVCGGCKGGRPGAETSLQPIGRLIRSQMLQTGMRRSKAAEQQRETHTRLPCIRAESLPRRTGSFNCLTVSSHAWPALLVTPVAPIQSDEARPRSLDRHQLSPSTRYSFIPGRASLHTNRLVGVSDFPHRCGGCSSPPSLGLIAKSASGNP